MGNTLDIKKELADSYELFLQCVLALTNTSKTIVMIKEFIKEERKANPHCSSCLFGSTECIACIINESKGEKMLKNAYDIFEKEANVLFETVKGLINLKEVEKFTSDDEALCSASLLKEAINKAFFKED